MNSLIQKKIIFFAITFGFQGAQAIEMGQFCQRAVSAARTACTTKDTTIGVANPSHLQELAAEVRQYGENAQRSRSCATMASRHLNQARMSKALAQIADEKAQACMVAHTMCESICSQASQKFTQVADVYKKIEEDDLSGTALDKAQSSNQGAQTCESFQNQVQLARRQAEDARAAEQSNLGSYQELQKGQNGVLADSNADCRGDGNIADLFADLQGHGISAPPAVGQQADSGSSFTRSSQANGSLSGATDGFANGSANGAAVNSPPTSLAGGSNEAEVKTQKESGSHIERSPASLHGSNSLGQNSSMGGGNSYGGGAPPRLSGSVTASRDGVTGPMGLSLFEKVSRQYQLQRKRLIPE